MTLNSLGFLQLSTYIFVQNFIKLRAAVRELSCAKRKSSAMKTIGPTVRRYRADTRNSVATNRRRRWSGREVLALWRRRPAVDGILCWTGSADAWSAGSGSRRGGCDARRPSGTRRRRPRYGWRRGCSEPATDHVDASRRPGTRSLPGNGAWCRSPRCPATEYRESVNFGFKIR